MKNINRIAYEINSAYVFSDFHNKLADMLDVVSLHKEDIIAYNMTAEDLVKMTDIPTKYTGIIAEVIK